MSELRALRDRTASLLSGLTALRRKNDVIKSVVLPTDDRELPAVLVSARQLMRRSEGAVNIGPAGYICDGTIVIVVRTRAKTESDLENTLLSQAEVATEGLLNDPEWMSELDGVPSIETRILTRSEGETLMGDAVITLTCRWREDFGAVGVDRLQTVRGTLPNDDDVGFGADELYPET